MAKRIPFNVVFASDEDLQYPSSELNSHGPTVQGWHSRSDNLQSLSSQEIVLRFQKPAKVTRIQVLAHQFLIPERIELWIHYSPKGAPSTPSSQTFEYLGFIALSDNSATNFKSRELQSVSVGPKNGTHLKLRLGEPHTNDLNKNKQVALIAVNILGYDLSIDNKTNGIMSTVAIPSNQTNAEQGTDTMALASICDDLSFSMYVEEGVADTIRDIEGKKLQAVNDERFEYARKLKLCMGALRSAGERLGRYSLAKRQAVQHEDFMTAKLRKEQIEIYRKSVYKQLQVDKLLDVSSQDNDSISEVYAQKPILPSPPSLQDVATLLTTESTFSSALSPNSAFSPRNSLHSHDVSDSISHQSDSLKAHPTQLDAPNSPKLYIGRSPNRGSPTTSTGSLRRRNKSAPRNSYEDYEERAVPALRHSHTNEFLRECQGAAMMDNDPYRGRSRLNERERRQAALPIIVFGNEMVELFYSRQFQDREEGLIRLGDILKGEEVVNYTAGANKVARSTTLLLHRAVRDAVFSVFSHATETVRALFVDFVPNRVTTNEVARCVDRLLPELLAKSGDPSPRIHTLAQHTILTIAACPEVREQHLVAPALSRAVGSGTHPRLALSRMQMLEQLVLSQGISTDKQSGLTCRALSECGCSGIHHPAESVRKVAERVLLLVYKVNPRLVRKQLPPDDDVTRRNLLYRQLFTEFDKLDLQRRKDLISGNSNGTALSPPQSAQPTKQLPLKDERSADLATLVSPPTSSTDTRIKSVRYESKQGFGYNGDQKSLTLRSNRESNSPMKRSETRILKSRSGNAININHETSISFDAMSPIESNGTGKRSPKLTSALKKSLLGDVSRKSSSNSDSFEDSSETENHCPFCGWAYQGNDSIQLDRHYWKACPILTKCPQCSLVLEVAALNSHLTSECDAKLNYIRCDRCTEAVPKVLHEQHLQGDYCKKLDCNEIKCPLCHDIVQTNSGGWKMHLLSIDGCPGNARRRSKI